MKNKQKQKQALWISNKRQQAEKAARKPSDDISDSETPVDHFADDDEEQFHRNLDSSDTDSDVGSSDYSDHEDDIMPLDVDSDSDDEDDDEEDDDSEIDEILGKKSRKERDFQEISDKAWGDEKKKFYDRDVNIDNDDKINRRKRKALREKEEDYAKEEEQEAIRLQKEKAKSLRPEDFIDDDDDDDQTIGSLIKKKNKKDFSFDEEEAGTEDEEVQEDDEDIQDSEERIALKRERLAKMSDKEKLELVKRDSPELIGLLQEYKTNINTIRSKIAPILEIANKRKELQNLKGVSFLELKYHLLLNYCTNISFYLLMKAEGKSVKDHPVIESLVRNRTVLEKMKPLDNKLKYQIDKLLKLASSGVSESDSLDLAEYGHVDDKDALSFRPSLENFQLDDGGKKKASKGDTAYVPPKLAASHFEETGYKKKDRYEQKAVKSSIAKFLKSTFSSEPEVLDASGVGIEFSKKRKEDLEEKEHAELEEENFFRVNLPKKSKKVRKESDLAREFSQLEDFSDLAALDKERDDDGEIENYRKEKALKKALETIGNEKKPRKQIHGDEDIPYPVALKPYQNKRKYEAEESDMGKKSRKVDIRDEDEMYQAQALKLKKRKENRGKDTGKKIIPKAEYTTKEGDKRKITYNIKTNKGLTPYRKKESRNSRVKLRGKFEKAKRKLTGAGLKSGTSGVALAPYRGESSIKTHVTHSTSMRDS